jgi:hypothetical protein
MSLGAADDSDFVDGFRYAGTLCRENPWHQASHLPIEQVSKFTFMINPQNRKSARHDRFPGIAVARRRNNRIEHDFRCWHETDVPTALRDVGSQGQSGKHILPLSFSVCDPERALAAQTTFAANCRTHRISCLCGKVDMVCSLKFIISYRT